MQSPAAGRSLKGKEGLRVENKRLRQQLKRAELNSRLPKAVHLQRNGSRRPEESRRDPEGIFRLLAQLETSLHN